jgi:NAD(P)-dependent dehydrogenase (short-subunit alcohol dehydrogenase family)
MEGFGSDGRTMRGLTLYGASKYGLAYLTDSLAKEVKGTNIIVGGLRPGMVVTDLITKPYEGKPEEWKKVKFIFSILADRVENVAPWLAEKVAANTKNGARFNRLNNGKLIYRFVTAPFIRRDPFSKIEGNL